MLNSEVWFFCAIGTLVLAMNHAQSDKAHFMQIFGVRFTVPNENCVNMQSKLAIYSKFIQNPWKQLILTTF